jgi:energy-coupling factor transporter ATP-binding protein EcfA2
MRTVFISYSHKDKNVAAKVKAVLEADGDIKVTIDGVSMAAGGDIRAFIVKAIRETQVTLSIVSKNSLASDWVALESVESFAAEKYVDGKKFIACHIDKSVFKDDFSLKATRRIDREINKLEDLISQHAANDQDPVHLQSKKSRKRKLKNSLPEILDRLLGSLTLDITEPEFDQSMQQVLETIRNLPELPSSPQSQARSSIESNHLADQARALDQRYLDWLLKDKIKNEFKYTKLAGRKHLELRNLFRRLPNDKIGIGEKFAQEASKEQREPFDNAVAEIQSLRRAVLLGDPGSGKSTTLWKLAEKLCEDSSRDPKAPLPVLVQLGLWTVSNETLTDFINREIRLLPAPIEQLLVEKRVAILLDGMNEIPTGQWKAKYEEIRDFISSHQDLIVVVSCRELDYTVDLRLDRIVILPLDPLRIRHFVRDYLGSERGESLFWKLVGGDSRKIHQQFIDSFDLAIADPEQTFWLANKLPQDFYFWQWNAWIKLRENPGSMLVLSRNPFVLKMICEIYEAINKLPENKGKLFGKFVEVLIQREIDSKRALQEEMEPLLGALSKLAYEMQINPSSKPSVVIPEDSEEDDEDDDADESTNDSVIENANAQTSLTVVRVKELIGERSLQLALSANLLAGNNEIRFSHQLLQEYFTAIYMEEEISSGRLKATQIWPSESWWERTNWEVATRLLAGLHTDDCSKVVNWVAEANPEVAAECIVLSGAALAVPTKKQLRKEWRRRLGDPARDPDPRARAAVGRALGLTGWDNRDGIGTVKVEIDGQTLLLPDFDKAWVEIPAGEFTCGHEDESDNPPRKVMLPAFRISRYPVTYAQFQTFIDDPEGYRNQDRWFEGLAADEDDRRLDDQNFRIEGKAYSNDPRESVNWYQSVAFCRWLSWRLDGGYDLKRIDQWKVRLPTELEWERAARGLDGRTECVNNIETRSLKI